MAAQVRRASPVCAPPSWRRPTARGALGTRRLPSRGGALYPRPSGRCGMRLPGEGAMRCRGVWLAPEGATGGALPPGRRLATRRRPMPTLVGALRALACLLGYLALLGRRQVHACASCLRQSDRDRLPGRSRAVLALADVMNLLADEFSSLCGRRLPWRLSRFALRSVSLSGMAGFLDVDEYPGAGFVPSSPAANDRRRGRLCM